MRTLEQFEYWNSRGRRIRWEIKQRHALVMPKWIGHVCPIEEVPGAAQRLGSVLSRLVVLAPGHCQMDAKQAQPTEATLLDGANSGGLPAEQKEVPITQLAAVRQNKPA